MPVSCLGFFRGLKADECRRPHLIEVGTEARHSFRIETIEASGAGCAVNDKADLFKHLEVLGNSGAGDREGAREFVNRQRPAGELLEDGHTVRVPEGV